jgi:hypothetical protein
VNGGYGHIEIGDQEGFGFSARALDYGGLVFEDNKPATLAEALAALEKHGAQGDAACARESLGKGEVM